MLKNQPFQELLPGPTHEIIDERVGVKALNPVHAPGRVLSQEHYNKIRSGGRSVLPHRLSISQCQHIVSPGTLLLAQQALNGLVHDLYRHEFQPRLVQLP